LGKKILKKQRLERQKQEYIESIVEDKEREMDFESNFDAYSRKSSFRPRAHSQVSQQEPASAKMRRRTSMSSKRSMAPAAVSNQILTPAGELFHEIKDELSIRKKVNKKSILYKQKQAAK